MLVKRLHSFFKIYINLEKEHRLRKSIYGVQIARSATTSAISHPTNLPGQPETRVGTRNRRATTSWTPRRAAKAQLRHSPGTLPSPSTGARRLGRAPPGPAAGAGACVRHAAARSPGVRSGRESHNTAGVRGDRSPSLART